MKRLVFALIILLLVPSLSFATENVDLAAMSVEEIVVLKTRIAEELMTRGELKTVEVPMGDYVVGKDIPSGEYSVTTKSEAFMLTVYNKDGTLLDYYYSFDDESIGRLVLENGQQVSLMQPMLFSVYEGLGF